MLHVGREAGFGGDILPVIDGFLEGGSALAQIFGITS
jgi:hypothetical protein